ncbi:MAG: condensation domain-containing protein, partial [Candidatus Saccharimonadales bacterium]
DVVYGATLAGRPAALAGADSMIGLFINTLPVRARMAGEALVVDWLRALQMQLADARQHEQTPLASIRGWSELRPGVPLFESLFVFENYPIDAALRAANVAFRSANESSMAERKATLGGLRLNEVESRSQTNFPLNVVVSPGDEITLRVSYDALRFEPQDIEQVATEYQETLAWLVVSADRQINELASNGSERPLRRSAEGRGDDDSQTTERHGERSLPTSRGRFPVNDGHVSRHIEPRSETELLLADIWRDVLRLDRVGVEENFFDLGGDSIQAVRVMSLAAAKGRSFPPQIIFERPTIAALAAVIDRAPRAADQPHGASCIVPIHTGGTRRPLVC